MRGWYSARGKYVQPSVFLKNFRSPHCKLSLRSFGDSVPNRDDIVHLDFDPYSGQEMQEPHFGLVLSGKVFNQQGLAMICPVSQGTAAAVRTYGTVVTLMGMGTDTQGAVHCHPLKSLDGRVRKVHLKETVPQSIVDEVLARIEAILFD